MHTWAQPRLQRGTPPPADSPVLMCATTMALCPESPICPECLESSHRAEGLSWDLERSRGNLQAPELFHKPPQSLPLWEALTSAQSTLCTGNVLSDEVTLGPSSFHILQGITASSCYQFQVRAHQFRPPPLVDLSQSSGACRSPSPTTCSSLASMTWLLGPWQSWAHYHPIQGSPTTSSGLQGSRDWKPRGRKGERVEGVG